MLDFVSIDAVTNKKNDSIVVTPKFEFGSGSDLMTKGHSFMAVWDEANHRWSTQERDVWRIVDDEIKATVEKTKELFPASKITPLYLHEFSNKKWSEWIDYVKKSPDCYHELDSKVVFSNTETKKEDYSSKTLPYPLKEGDHKSYDTIMSTLYDPSERDKLEWAIGSVIAGDSRTIQKFVVLYGEAGTGKSTVIHIIEKLFQGYTTTFNSKSLGQSSNSFSLEPFKNNPLIAIEHDGDLSRIEDNTKLNSIISHERMVMNEKHKSQYTMKFNTFIFIGTNKPVKITEARSGLLRRLIDVTPSGRKIPFAKYEALMNQIQFELGAIAYHCLKKYQSMGKSYYDKYKPNSMFSATNDFYNFVSDNYDFFSDKEGVTLAAAWDLYGKYAEEANFQVRCSRRVFMEELKSYFNEFRARDGSRYKVFVGLKKDKFDYISVSEEEKDSSVEGCEYILKLDESVSLFDREYADCPAQLAREDETPEIKWTNVKTTLKDIDTSKLHYILVPDNMIVIDFDIRDENGNKDPVANLIAASKFPPTYAEFSKSGAGIHLHYIYDGDVLSLSRIYEPGIEIKVFKNKDGSRGYSSLRRRLTKCNCVPIAHINSGLPLKGANNVVNFEAVKNEKAIRTLITGNLMKRYHPDTSSSVNFIYSILEDAYKSGATYDVTDLRPAILTFASRSTNQASRCIDLVAKMKFKSGEEPVGNENYVTDAPIIFFDVEVFPNLFLICWKFRGTKPEETVKMINPSPDAVKKLFNYRLVGFNNRRYDNHILYAASLGYTVGRIYKISQEIVSRDKSDNNKNCFFSEAYNLSYADIYDFASEKMSLKKWEIKLGIHHQELGLPWDQEVDESLWDKVAEYCINDVVATEAVFEARHADYITRQLLADMSGLTVNDPNRLHITKILVGNDRKPNHVYTNLATGEQVSDGPLPEDNGLINSFPGYEFVWGEDKKPHNMYRGTDVGFGGYVFAKPGMYTNVALLDVGNMHGASIVALNKFGVYTKNYAELRTARMAIKAHDFEKARGMLGGKLSKTIDEIMAMEKDSEEQNKAINDLQKALKLILNSTYGIAAATFDNPLRDPRDKNNIIALRGALFMRTLQDEIVAKGFDVIHIKTDSVKIPNATPEIINYIMEFGRKYGYEFEHEATYEKMCLVNNAVYIAKYDDKGVRNKGGAEAGEWTATGAQFAQPYVFKTLFSKEPIKFDDMCETKETSKGLGLYLDYNEGLGEEEHHYHFIGRVGQFCPVKSGCRGGALVRELDGKFHAVTGTKKEKLPKGSTEEPIYRWLEAEYVRQNHLEDEVDETYYKKLVDDAVEDISKFGDFEWFTSDDPVPPPVDMSFMNIPESDEEEVPFL